MTREELEMRDVEKAMEEQLVAQHSQVSAGDIGKYMEAWERNREKHRGRTLGSIGMRT